MLRRGTILLPQKHQISTHLGLFIQLQTTTAICTGKCTFHKNVKLHGLSLCFKQDSHHLQGHLALRVSLSQEFRFYLELPS